MTRQTKYVRGEVFTSMEELCDWLEADGWVYMKHKVTHPGWVIGMQLRTVVLWLRAGNICHAIERESA